MFYFKKKNAVGLILFFLNKKYLRELEKDNKD